MVLSAEGNRAGEDDEGDDADGPVVDFFAVLFLLEYLRRDIAGRSARGARELFDQFFAVSELPSEAEVCDFQ